MSARPRAPEELGPAGRTAWKEMVASFEYGPGELALLRGFCEQVDRLEQAREAVARDGAFVQGRDGVKEHPALGMERRTLGVLGRLLKQLRPAPSSPRRLGGPSR